MLLKRYAEVCWDALGDAGMYLGVFGMSWGYWDVLDSGWLQSKCDTTWANVCTEKGRDKHFAPAVEYTAGALREDRTVVVHCVRGRHRAGAFLAG